MAQQKKRSKVAPKDLRSLKAVGVAGLRHGQFADLLSQESSFPGSMCCKKHAREKANLPVGTVVRLVREAQNLFDPLAIRIDEEETGRKIGHVPTGMNGTLARLIDAGYPLYGAVLDHDRSKNVSDPKRIQVAVYIERAKVRR